MDFKQNGATWYDTNGDVLHAHGGHILKFEGVYYWYGENRTGNNYVSCYKSTDLMEWTFCNNIITTKSKTEGIRIRTDLSLVNEVGGKVNLERPKVIYNKETKTFVLWVHFENGKDYSCAGCAIATCDKPDGDFTYHGWFRPFGYMSRDCTLFEDRDGTAYFLSASRDNADMHVYRLSSDYMNVDKLVNKLWPGEYREAPAVMLRNGIYYMFSSFCTGWAPNQCRYATAGSIDGDWSILTDIGDKTTYDTQPAFILPVTGENETVYLYVSDRWVGSKGYDKSTYVVLPIEFDADGKPELNYYKEFSIDIKNGRYIAGQESV